jgi:RNA polymerase sigma-70 factor (ECF subfamily)
VWRSITVTGGGEKLLIAGRELSVERGSDRPIDPDVETRLSATDGSLVRRFCRGENDAATQLYLRYAERLGRLARQTMSPKLAIRVDPDDVVQSVFRTFFRRTSEGLLDVPPGDQLWQLLLAIATNKVRHLGRYHRQQKRDVSRTVASDQVVSLERFASDHVPMKILELVIRELLESQTEVQRQMIEMRIQGYTAPEISAATKRCSRTVERVIKRFRDDLKRHVEGFSDDDNLE